MAKQLILTKHAAERFLQRRIQASDIEKMLDKGVRLRDPESNAVLCIYRDKERFLTIVFDEDEEKIAVITAYDSSKWQIEQFERVKKNECNKMR